jgi:Ca-activated chloride channel family protein
MMDITFAHPKFLFLLLLVPLFIYWSIQKRHKAFASFNIPTLEGIKSINSLKVKLLPLLNVLRIVGFIALVLALARPQKALSEREVTTEGIDLVLALDVSGSMLALDFQPDRLGCCQNSRSRIY